jgi:hypothetical protein
VETLAPAPASTEEQHTVLEDKIVKQCIREFTKGGMYFAYTFGEFFKEFQILASESAPDITRSLQHKQQQVAKSQKQHALLADLNALPTPEARDSMDNQPLDEDARADVLAEPYPTLPLWRRVDRQFWWNEWMAKPFIDAGVRSMLGYPPVLICFTGAPVRPADHARVLPDRVLCHPPEPADTRGGRDGGLYCGIAAVA